MIKLFHREFHTTRKKLKFKRMKKLIVLTLVFMMATAISAEIKLPAIFADNMLMQQETTANIWGKAKASSKVTVITGWNLKSYSTASDAEGNWKLSFTTPKAGGPYTIVVKDDKILTLKNILIGELWLCSGQSNMEMPMKGYKNQPVAGSNMDILKSANPNIRLFTVKRAASLKDLDDVTGRWEEAMPVSVRDFSATAYYFGRLINETLKVPVGLISTSWGGSAIEAWMTEDMLKAFPSAKIPSSLEGIKDPNRTAGALYPAMIKPLETLALKGVIWYQGETNCERADSYAQMFKSMVEGWRSNWKQQDTIPFYFCQIAPFDYNGSKTENRMNSAFLREAQAKAEKITPKTAMAVLMDLGQEKCIHPEKKKEGGERLALQALKNTYNFAGISAEGAVYKDIEIKNDTVIVSFDRTEMWVTAPEFKSKLFKLAGSDKVFYPAKAWISRSKVYVTCAEVPNPIAVRYAFDDFVIGDLFDTNGLPVSSFRSDNW